jgi:hypothetical protein
MRKLVTILAPLVMVAAGCAAEGDGISDLDESQRRQAVSMFDIYEGTLIDNSSVTLRRDPVSTTFEVQTVVTPGDVYTAWICGWNDPSECQFGGAEAEGNNLCGVDDLDTPSAFCQHAGGAVATSTGELTIRGFDYDGAEVLFSPSGNGLINPMGAEIQIVIRTHGQALPDLLAEQLSEYEGGCEVNACDATQYGIFPPIQ